jgi:hypothetical protein
VIRGNYRNHKRCLYGCVDFAASVHELYCIKKQYFEFGLTIDASLFMERVERQANNVALRKFLNVVCFETIVVYICKRLPSDVLSGLVI